MRHSFLLLLCFWSTSAHALVLEELAANNTLQTTLQNKKVGYFVGSFDPLHKAHEAIVETALNKTLCDYIILHPVEADREYRPDRFLRDFSEIRFLEQIHILHRVGDLL